MLVGVGLDVVGVSSAVDVVHPAPKIGLVCGLQVRESGFVGTRGGEVDRDELGHFVEAVIRRVGKLDEPKYIEIVDRSVEDIQVQLRASTVPFEERFVNKRDLGVVPRGENDGVDRFLRSVRKYSSAAGEPCHVGFGNGLAMSEVVQCLGIENRVRCESVVVRGGQAEAGQISH